MKKLLCYLLALTMVLTMMPFSMAEGGDYSSGDFRYTLNTAEEATITGCKTKSGTVQIPSVLDGHAVTGIAEDAFSECYGLITVIIPKSVTRIEGNPFKMQPELKEIALSSDHPELEIRKNSLYSKSDNRLIHCLADYSTTTYVAPSGTEIIENAAFAYRDQLTTVVLPQTTKKIGNGAFYGCSSLDWVDLGSSLTEIGPFAFYSTRLEEIEFPDTLEKIGDHAYAYCFSLKELELPESVKEIGWYAFGACSSLEKVNIPGSLTKIDDYTFYSCNSLKKIYIPYTVSYVGEYAFYGCTALTEAVLYGYETQLSDTAFEGCASLDAPNYMIVERDESDFHVYYTQVDGEDYAYTVNYLGEATLKGADVVRSVLNIPAELDGYPVTELGEYSFWGNPSFEYVTIPDTVKKIGAHAFEESFNIKELTIPDSVTEIGDFAFSLCDGLTEIYIPASVSVMGMNPFMDCSNMKEIIISPNSKSFETIGGGLISKADKRFISYPCQLTEGEYKIPAGITMIDTGAFAGNTSLRSVSMPDSLNVIGSAAFAGCSKMFLLNIPKSVTEIGQSAFAYCSRLNYILIPENVRKIGERAFMLCDSLQGVAITGPLEEIGECAFINCPNLKDVNIPNSVVYIGDDAFFGCNEITLMVAKDSYASLYAIRNGIRYAS